MTSPHGPLYALAAAAVAITVVVACRPADAPTDTQSMKDSLRKAGEVVKEKRIELEDGGPAK